MKSRFLFFVMALLLATKSFAQITDKYEIEQQPQPVRKSKVPIWLNASPGLGIANCYDNGTIPFHYLGLGGHLNLGLTIEWMRCHVQTESRIGIAIMSFGEGNAIDLDNKMEFLYRFHDSSKGRWHFWVGGAFQVFYDIKEMPNLMNASSGMSMFYNLCATGMVQYDFAYIKGGSHNLMTAYGKVSLPMVGWVNRPGYAYLDNYTSDLNVSNTILNDYESFFKPFPGVSTNIGLNFNLLNGNVIGLSYRWDYLSTGNKGTYRFDNAFHSINLNFMFNLN